MVCSRRGRAEAQPGRAGCLPPGTPRLWVQWTLCGHSRAESREGGRAPSGGQSWSHMGTWPAASPHNPPIRRNKVRGNIFLNASSRFLWQLEKLLIPKYNGAAPCSIFIWEGKQLYFLLFTLQRAGAGIFKVAKKTHTHTTVSGFPCLHLEAPGGFPGSKGAEQSAPGSGGRDKRPEDRRGLGTARSPEIPEPLCLRGRLFPPRSLH